jgi:Flp pilus assembly protein TadG
MLQHRPTRLFEFVGCRKGSVAIEFALIIPVALMMLFGIVEVGRAMWVRTSLQFVAEEGARYMMVHQNAPDAELSAFALGKLVGVDPALVDLSFVRETVDGTDFVTINATFQFQYMASLIGGEPFVLTGSSRAPLLE